MWGEYERAPISDNFGVSQELYSNTLKFGGCAGASGLAISVFRNSIFFV